MPWLQLAVEVPPGRTEAIARLLEGAGALAVTLCDGGETPRYEPAPGETPLWNRVRVFGLFEEHCDIDLVRRLLHTQLPEAQPDQGLTVQHLADQPWERVWLDRFRPMCFADRLWVCPGDQPAPDPSATVLFLDPGLAFGTGTHPSTALCLEWLAQAELAGATVVDYGCGSGILAIAAAVLGASQIWAVDHDPQALLATRENARRNDVEAKIRLLSPSELPDLHADLVLANILAETLIALAPQLTALLERNGRLVLCGILSEQSERVIAAFQGRADPQCVVEREGWTRIDLRRL